LITYILIEKIENIAYLCADKICLVISWIWPQVSTLKCIAALKPVQVVL